MRPSSSRPTAKARTMLTLGALSLGVLALGLTGCVFGGKKAKEAADVGFGAGVPVPDLGVNGAANTKAEIGVNAFLWRASLETVAFMPLASVDPFGGVIITDWYINPDVPNERFKITIFILDTRLRADALTVSLSKQIQSPTGWADVEPNRDAIIALEDAILTRARQLRIATLDK